MTEPTPPEKGTIEENVEREIKALGSDIKALAEDIRSRISLAGEDAKGRWTNLDAERKRFLEKLERAAAETRADLRQVGSDLKGRLQGLQKDLGLDAKGEEGG